MTDKPEQDTPARESLLSILDLSEDEERLLMQAALVALDQVPLVGPDSKFVGASLQSKLASVVT